jgi:hypothetical protein
MVQMDDIWTIGTKQTEERFGGKEAIGWGTVYWQTARQPLMAARLTWVA